MRCSIDDYAHLRTPLHRWDCRCKLVALLALMFAFAAVEDMRLLPVVLALATALYALSRLPLSFLLARLRLPALFVLVVALLLPFSAGATVLLHLGPLALRQEGLLAALLIGVRFAAILTTGVVLFGTSPFLTTIRAMYALGLPATLNDMTLFFYRYLHDLGEAFATMQQAMRLRGFEHTRLNRHTLGALAALVGSLLVRSYEQSQRVYQAMVLRGYGQCRHPRATFRATAGDLAALVGVFGVALGLVTANVVLQ